MLVLIEQHIGGSKIITPKLKGPILEGWFGESLIPCELPEKQPRHVFPPAVVCGFHGIVSLVDQMLDVEVRERFEI